LSVIRPCRHISFERGMMGVRIISRGRACEYAMRTLNLRLLMIATGAFATRQDK